MSDLLETMSESMLYDIFNANCDEDIEMYKEMCINTSPILELGIGTGRLAIPLARSGIHVVGIDNSSEMLSVLKNKIDQEKIENISFYEQDMRSLSMDSKFNIVLCPFCTFNFLLTIDDQEKALLSIRPLLSEGAIIIFDLLTVNTFSGSFTDGTLKHFDSYICPNENATIEIYTSSKFNQASQIFSQERVFRKYTHGLLTAERHLTMRNRLFFLGEFYLLLSKCGFKILNKYGSYKFSSFSQSSQELIVIASLI